MNSMMRAGALAVLLLVAASGCAWWQAYNAIVSSNEEIDASWAQVENVLQRRYDLIPNVVNTVKGYADHERGTLEEITRLRSQWGEARGASQKAGLASALEGALGRLMVVVENYPELKANENFRALQDELAGTENRIAVERRRYNDAVRAYNALVRRFPSNLVAGRHGYARSTAYFEAAETARQAPTVQF